MSRPRFSSIAISTSEHGETGLRALLVATVMLVLCLVSPLAHAQFAGGSGTLSDPWQIATAQQLDSVRHHLDGHFVLIEDISIHQDPAPGLPWQGSGGWEPLGGTTGFSGTLDGQGHGIGDLYIKRPETDAVGLFSRLTASAVVQNLNVAANSVTGRNHVGVIAGFNEGRIYRTEVWVNLQVEGHGYVGGATGCNCDGTLEQVDLRIGRLGGQRYVGGVAGLSTGSLLSASVTVNHLYAQVISAADMPGFGGLVGVNAGSIRESSAKAAMSVAPYPVGQIIDAVMNAEEGDELPSGTVVGAGGLVGINQGLIETSYASGDVEGTLFAGGLTGLNEGTIQNSFARGSASAGIWAGGLVGGNDENGLISFSYATGRGAAVLVRGGLVAENLGTVNNSFWDSEATAQHHSAAGTPLTTTQMQAKETFIADGWDFLLIWAQSAAVNDAYPHLLWDAPPPDPVFSGTLSGLVSGSQGKPVLVENADILDHTQLRYVNIGAGNSFGQDVLLLEGVQFLANEFIPPGIDLSRLLPQAIGNPYFSPFFRRYLGSNVVEGSYPSILERVQALDPEIVVAQDDWTGLLTLTTGNSISAMLPAKISQAWPGQAAGFHVTDDGVDEIVTADGRVILAYPAVLAKDLFDSALDQLGLSSHIRQRAGSAGPVQSYRLLWSDVRGQSRLSVPLSGQACSGVAGASRCCAWSALLPHGSTAEYVVNFAFRFLDENLRLMTQELVPVPEDWPALKALLSSLPQLDDAWIDDNGTIWVSSGPYLVRGRVDHKVLTGGNGPVSGKIEMSAIGDVNGDGTGDFLLTYQMGASQILYVYP